MNILINFSTLKAGGGQNVALNFLLNLYRDRIYKKDNFYYIVPHSSVIDKYLSTKVSPDKILRLPINPIKRIFYEKFKSSSFLESNNIDVIYSYFGYGFFPKKYVQIIGCALSNLFYPEIKFWAHYSGIGYVKKRFIDYIRLYGIFNADGIIFETNCLEKRCNLYYANIKADTTTILPSIVVPEIGEDFYFPSKVKGTKKGLFLCGWQFNKNYLMIPLIASYLKTKKIPYLFVLTAPLEDTQHYMDFLNLLDKYDVREYVYMSGKIPKSKLQSLYLQIDHVFLLSNLESFSNNIIEAWTYKKLLFISDLDWSKSICTTGAVYVNQHSASNIGDAIIYYIENKSVADIIIEQGSEQLNFYPSIENRTMQEFKFIKDVYKKRIKK